ncbi:DUF711 family protein [Kiloniella sp.]|uniref:DUF711 family protein n=1 Tax=Kiloniella sp. TaxID=1938587 RepID=UPI003B01EDCB
MKMPFSSEHSRAGFENKDLCRIRTVTAFLVLDKDRVAWSDEIAKASTFCGELAATFSENGYTVQTIRIVTNPFGEYLNTSSIEATEADLAYISDILKAEPKTDLRIRFAIGEAKTAHEIALLPRLIQSYGDLCNACVNIDLDKHGVLNNDLITHSAKAVKEISRLTPRGEGNFNFTVNFNCEPLIPYFPAGYHQRERGNCFVVGLETPDLLVHALKVFNKTHPELDHNTGFKGYFDAMSTGLQHHVSQILSIINHLDGSEGFSFAGIDSSAAPSKDCASLAEVYELMGVEYFGAAGTVEASSLLTRVFKSIQGVDLVGFSGLMLAVTEDEGLAEGTRKSNFDIQSLLTFSAVCGIGLDTVPIPGDTPLEKITAIMRDTGTMAFRLNKPLTVRLFPVPGLHAGDLTAFESDDLCNCAVMAVP